MSNTKSSSKTPQVVGSVTAAELARIIDDAALFACRDTALPMINAIRLESTAKQLIAVATDRFTLGASVATYSEDGLEFNASLKLPQAQTLAKIAKSCKAAFAEVVIGHADDKLTFAFSSGESLTLPVVTGTVDFPDWRKIIARPEGEEEKPVSVVGYNPSYLARFSRVHGASRIAIKFISPTRPALISVGTQFFGLIMPVRLGSDNPDWQSPDWISVKPTEPAAESPAESIKPATKPRAPRRPRAKKTAA